MGGELMSSSEIFVKTVTDCDQWLISHEYPGCKEIIEAGEDDGLAAKDAAKLQAFQSAIFVLEVAVARMLTSWNIMPAAVLGHR
jgi:acyl transferase domain-containing protein